MSVPKHKRHESYVEFLSNAYEILSFTIKQCVKFPKRYTFFLSNYIVKFVHGIPLVRKEKTMLIYEKNDKLNILFNGNNSNKENPDIQIYDDNGTVVVKTGNDVCTLPKVSSDDNGKTLVVENGEWVVK